VADRGSAFPAEASRRAPEAGKAHADKNESMKQPWEWIEEDIAGLIANKVQEHLGLDYEALRCTRQG
jgi:hypothetical protein